ncbi:histone modifying enzyme [Lithospermum erythrorhizon]|uniref:histone acetyltransferase n=1 Tax=Lithospermum erythrorhizon TaxID=34254 RepID=A0AAV3P3W8_LITER
MKEGNENMSGPLPNTSVSSMSGKLPFEQKEQEQPRMNGNYQMSGKMENTGGPRPSMEPDISKVRRYMSQRIYECIMRRKRNPHEAPQKKMFELVNKLEECLFKIYGATDEYMNLATLESRIHGMLRPSSLGSHNLHHSHVNSSSLIGKMIPTPGMPQNGSSAMTTSVDNSMVVSSSNPRESSVVTSLPLINQPADEAFSNGYQHLPSSFSTGAIRNMGMRVERMPAQMIPTPGLSSATSDRMKDTSNSLSCTSSNVNSFLNADSLILSQPVLQKPLAGEHNSHILQDPESCVADKISPSLPQTTYGVSNETVNARVGMIGNNIKLLKGTGVIEGQPLTTMHGACPEKLDQRQRPLLQGDSYGVSTGDDSESSNLDFPGTSVNAVPFQSMRKTDSSMLPNESNILAALPAKKLKQESADQLKKLSYPCDNSFLENIVPSHQQFQQKPQKCQKELQYQHQLNQHKHKELCQQSQQNQNKQILLKNNPFDQSHVSSDLRGQVKFEPGLEHHNEVQPTQASVRRQFSDVPFQCTQNSVGIVSESIHSLSIPSAPQGSLPLQNQTSRHLQHMEHPQQFLPDTVSEFSNLSCGLKSDVKMQTQWSSESKDASQAPVNVLGEQNVCQELSQRIRALDEVQNSAYMNRKSVSTKSEEPSNVSCSDSRSGNHCTGKYKYYQRWILFLRHASRCPYPVGKCRDPTCENVQILLKHVEQCSISKCVYPRCLDTRVLINHYRQCRDTSCPVCVPVKNYIAFQLKAYSRSGSRLPPPNSVGESRNPYSIGDGACELAVKNGPGVDDDSVHLEPPLKRLKFVQNSLCTTSDTSTNREATHKSREPHVLQETRPVKGSFAISMPVKHGSTDVDEGSREITKVDQLKTDDYCINRPHIEANMLHNPAAQENIKVEAGVNELKHDNISIPTGNASATMSEKPKIKGVSLTELFTPFEVREHICGLRQWVGQCKAKAEKNQALEHAMSENSCQLCAVEKLAFDPPVIYCSPCGARIKRNAMYYTIGASGTRHYFCVFCYNESRGDTILIDRSNIPKARMEKKKNDEETEEGWVQCDKCESWQHQICALFNGKRNDHGQAEYICPNCYIEEVEGGERILLPQSAVLGAKDLPKTILSDHIEKRLSQKLEQERQERAMYHEKSSDEVPGVDGLVVRVVSSVDKKLEVKPKFLEIFKENYPSEFQYKSKVLLLFQKIEGVEVCLFGMYFQEFGSECQQPNHRRVYLSYLDSVKYFRPEVKTISGEALRTFVYHEILIGYLEYCKLRGFTSCYIWACPPLKGEDYILYCHPEIQKTPKSDKLREWYLSMLRKATRENIVTDHTNLYDHFFVTTGECRAKVTAARLPYFDGDYFPGAAEEMICQLQQEEEVRKQCKKGAIKKSITKRALKGAKGSGQTDLSGDVSEDLLLMRKLGETICAMKEDFIMVHLQHACSHCCILMVSGNRWVCNICENFQLCDTCYEAEQKLEDRDRHPINQKDEHTLRPVAINDVPEVTKDEDEILESEFFDTRQAFLSLCQGNHYQYDTLRRAKHSSMMVLYHLHNPTAPAYVSTCNVCHLDIEAGQGWRCETCPDYDVCNACYSKYCGINHPHKLTNHPSMADRDAQNKEARQLRVTQLKKMLELLVHASRCHFLLCEFPDCHKVKGLFRHGMQCKLRASGGCPLCKRMWHLLQLHARACKESECDVPRCRDLKGHLMRLQQQSDSRRRAAVVEMMRQRAAEIGGNRKSR